MLSIWYFSILHDNPIGIRKGHMKTLEFLFCESIIDDDTESWIIGINMLDGTRIILHRGSGICKEFRGTEFE